jgi:hypothetical protein
MHALVDAFLKGRATLKRTKGEYFDNLEKPKKADAIGAICYGLYKKSVDKPIAAIKSEWPQINYWVKVPCGHDDEGGLLSSVLIHLNDEHTAHDWSDKKIADWLDVVLAGQAYPTKENFDKTMQ